MKGMKGKRLLAILLSVMLTAGSMSGAAFAAETPAPTEAGTAQLSEDTASSIGEGSLEQEAAEEAPPAEETSEEAPATEELLVEAQAEQTSAEEAPTNEPEAEGTADRSQENSAEDTETAQNEAKKSSAQDTPSAPDTGSAQETEPESNRNIIEEEIAESVRKAFTSSGVFDGDSPEDFHENSIPVYVGKNIAEISVTEGGLFRFEPDYNETYTFFTEGEYDTIGSIFGEIDGEMYALTADDNSGEDNNFSVSYGMEEYEAYYLGVMFADYETGSGTRKITLRIMTDDCGDHWPQEGTEVVTVATCTEEGYTTYFCGECGHEYRDDYTDPMHKFGAEGTCTLCGAEAPFMVQGAELHEDEYGYAYVEVAYMAASYNDDDEYAAYVEIQEENSENDPYVEVEYINASAEGSAYVYLYEDLPQYYIVKAYIKDTDSDRIISNIYQNNLHSKEMYDLIHSTAEDYDQARTIEFSEDSFGVLSDDTVIILGTATVNTIEDFSDYTYYLTNADAHTDKLKDGCEFAYFYDDEIRILAHVTRVTRPETGTVVIETENPALDEVFELLKLEEDVDNAECTMYLSDLPEGVIYMGEGELFEDAVAEVQSKESFAISKAGDDEGDSFGDEAGQAVSRPAAGKDYSELQETKTTLAHTQKYSFLSKKIGNAELNGDVTVGLSIPLKMYISHSRWSIDYRAEATVTGSLSLSGEASGSIPLAPLYIPIAGGMFSVNMDPELFIDVGGEISVSASFNGAVTGRADNESGSKIISKEAKFNMGDLAVECSIFEGIDLVPTLNMRVGKRWKVIELHCKIGPQMTASMSTPIPENNQVAGDHICQKCIDGDGHIVVQITAKADAFVKKFSKTHTFRLKEFEFYYSFDFKDGGRGICPHVKEREWNGDDEYDETEYSGLSVLFKGHYYNINDPKLGSEDGSLTWREDFALYSDGTLVFWGNYIVPGSDALSEETRGELDAGYWYENYESIVKNVIIYNGAFYVGDYFSTYYKSLKKVYIPSSVREVSSYAFQYCESLQSVSLPQGLTTIGAGTFRGCDSLTEITIPQGVTSIGEGAFEGCSKLNSISIPSSVTSIGDDAFYMCTNLQSVSLPQRMTSIGFRAFYECSNLKDVTMPSYLESIGAEAFCGCRNITSDIVISGNELSIGDGAFKDCVGIKSVNISAKHTDIGDDTLQSGTFEGCSKLETVSISGDVSIENDAFSNCSELKKLSVTGDVEDIKYRAFSDCTNLKDIGTLKGVTNIESMAFENCSSLEKMVIEGSLTSIEGDTFSGCTSLTSIKIPKSVTTIERSAFNDCSSLTDITIPPNVTSIGDYAFNSCSSLTNVIIPEGVTFIGERVFESCDSLESAKIPSTLKTIPYKMFSGCGMLTQVEIAEGVESIDGWVFSGCDNLENITIPSTVTSIADGVFDGCFKLKSIVIPTGVTRIEWATFYCCYVLENVVIPDTVNYIGESAFAGCYKLKEITIPDGVSRIESQAFDTCSELKSVVIPASVTSIGYCAFRQTWIDDIYYAGKEKEWAEIEIEAGNSWLQSAKIHCSDTKEDLSDAVISGLTSMEYTGEPIVQTPTVSFGSKLLSSGTDYTVLYSNNTNVGTATITFTGIGNYTGTAEKTFKITPKPVTPTIALSPASFTYNGKEQKPSVTVKDGNTVLSESDYAVTWPSGYTDAGSYRVRVTLKGNYTGSGEASYKIDPKPVTPTITLSPTSFTYNGKEQKPEVTVKDGNTALSESDYTVTWPFGCTNEGTYKVTVTLKGNYSGSGTADFKIAPQPGTLDTLTVTLSNASFTYTGKMQRPEVTVKLGSKILTSSDYDIAWPAGCVNPGEYEINVTLKGAYAGTVAKKYKIVLGKTTRGDMFNLANNVKVTWKEVPGAKYYKVYRSGVKDPVIVTSGLVGWDKTAGLVNGQKYTYKIVASTTGKGNPGGDSPISYSKVMYRLKTVAIRSATNTAPGKVTVKYDKTTAGDSYVLQYGERQDMVGAKTKVVMGANTTSYVLSGLKKGKTYYISIRVRKKVNGIDYYTTFGVPKEVKIVK